MKHTAELSQQRAIMAVPMHRNTARAKKALSYPCLFCMPVSVTQTRHTLSLLPFPALSTSLLVFTLFRPLF